MNLESEPLRNDKDRAGFSLLEAALSTVVVAVMLVAALNTVGASRITQHKVVLVCRGRLLAESLLAEILRQNYEDPNTPPVFGREEGELETTRDTYDDVDDYNGWIASPPVAQDGTALANAADWSRSVTVQWVDPLDPQLVRAEETGAKRITVVASFRNVPQATVVAVRTDH